MTIAKPVLQIFDDLNALAAGAADIVVAAARDAVAKFGRFTFVLSGGLTPENTYTLLAKQDRTSAIDWTKTYLFFGDERFVSIDDPNSNHGMVIKTLFSNIPIPSANIFPMPTNTTNAKNAAAAYSKTIADFFVLDNHNIFPRFDLIFLGLGSDGHTASLFPHSAALNVADAFATWSPPGILPPAVDRITLTYPIINAARNVVFLVSGGNKAEVIRKILSGDANLDDLPAAGVQPVNGTITWLADKQAAQLL
jgi:6-phosphogluconolactonase